MNETKAEPRYRWVIVAAGGLMGCVAGGSMFALPVYVVPVARDTGWSVSGVSTAMTIAFIAMALGSVSWGAISDRMGPRFTVLAGSIGLATGLALASRATSLLQFQIVFGVVVGGSTAAIFAPMMACVTGWFETRRSLAVSLVSAGMGMAPMTMSPFAAWLVSHHDWRTSMLMIAGFAAAVMLPVAFLVRRAPAADGPAALEDSAAADDASVSVRQVVRSPQFVILLLTNFFCCATHSGPIFHTVSYAVACGIPMITAVTIYSLEGLSGLAGRLVFGVLGDRLGARRVLVAGLLMQACGATAYYFVRELGQFYAAAAAFGFIYAGVMPLYSVISRETFPLRMMGTVIGSLAMAGSLGMATGPVAGGLIFDRLGSYGGLFLVSGLLGLGAFLIALTFRPAAGMAGVSSVG